MELTMSIPDLSAMAAKAADHPAFSLAMVACFRLSGKLPAILREVRLWDSMRRSENRRAKASRS
jgi:hypothetical protein